MDWIGLICSLLALAAGMTLYIFITRSKWGKAHTGYQYTIMLGCLIVACVIGGILKKIGHII